MDSFPAILSDIEKSVLFHRKGSDICCIGSRESDRYITMAADECDVIYDTLKLMDGTRSFDEVQSIVDEPSRGQPKVDAAKLYEKCAVAGLAKSPSSGHGSRFRDEIDIMLVDLKTFSLVKLYPLFDVISSVLPLLIAVMLAIDVAALAAILFSGKSIPLDALLGDPRTLLYAWVIQIPAIVLHELSHATAAYRYGIRPKTLSFCVFYYCTLAFYVKIPGVYFKPPAQRVFVWGAGVFTNVFLAAAFTFLYLISAGQVQLFATVGVIVNLGMTLSNVIPLFYSDGYYILSTLLKTPNLRKKSLFGIRSLFKMGLKSDALIYWVYLLVTACFMIVFIGIQLYVVIGSVATDISTGLPLADMATKYVNVFLLAAVGIVVKLISSVSKAKRRA